MRVTERKFFVKQIFVAAAVFAGMFFLGCEIGLGPAVDTEAPEAFITYPEVSTAARGTITLSGTCTDDTKVERVIIKSLYNADNKSLSFPADRSSDAAPLATVAPNGENWDIQLEYDSATDTYSIGGTPLGHLPDGTYVVDVLAEDEYRKSTPASRSFDIDNTPPVFLLSNPTSLEGTPGTPYGRIVKVTGTIADSHSIDKMEVVAYRENGDPITLAKSEFSGFDKANTSVVIANYSADDEEDFAALDETDKALQRNYVALMGETGNVLQNSPSSYEPVTVNIAVKLTDNTENNSNRAGNVSEYSYITSPLATITGPLAGRAADKPFEAIDYMNILNGSYTGPGKDEVKNVLLGNGDNSTYKYLSHDKSTTNHSWLSMAVSPDNAPTFVVDDCDLDGRELDGTWNGIRNGSTLSISVNAGRDKVAFNPQNLSVKIYAAAGNGTFVQGADPVITFSKDTDDQYASGSKPFTDINGASVFTLSDRQDGTFKLHLPDTLTLTIGGKYYVVVEGTDTYGVDIVPSSYEGYGFAIASNGTAPSVECDEAKKYYKGEHLYTNSATGKLTIKIADKDTDLKTLAADIDVVEYEVKYYAGKYDTIEVINANELTPVASGTAYNGKLHPSDLVLISGETKKWTTKIPLGACPASGADNYTIVVRIKTYNGSSFGDWITYLVYADAKGPAITVTNAELQGTGEKKITPSSSGYKTSTDTNGATVYKYRLAGKMSDVGGSGVTKIRVKYNDGSWNDIVEPKVVDEFGWNYDLDVHEGKNQTIQILAYDDVENEFGPMTLDNITMDFTPPTIKLKEVNGTAVVNNAVNQYYTSKPVALKFTGEDTISIPTAVISSVKKNGVVMHNGSSDGYSTSGSNMQINDDALWEVHAYAEDSSGQKSNELVVKTTVDTTKPVISQISIMGTDRNNYYANDTLQFKIRYTETLSGLAKAGFSIHTPDMAANTWTVENDTTELAGKGTSVETTITASGFESENGGKNQIRVWLYDAAGNKSDPFDWDVYIDKTPPEVAVGWLGKTDSVLEEIPGTVYHKGTVTLYGTVSDEGGVAPLTFTMGGPEGPEIDGAAVTYTNSSGLNIDDESTFFQSAANWRDYAAIVNKYEIKGWKVVLTNPPDGKLTVVAEDMSGQTTSVSNFVNLVKDTDAPNLHVTNLENNGAIRETDLSDDKFTLRGTWNDLKDEGDPASGGSGTKTLTCKVGSTNVPVNSSSAPQTTASANWSIELSKDVLGLGPVGDIVLVATDNVGNSSSVTISGVVADYQKPTIGLSKVDGVAKTECDELYGKADSSLALEISADDDWGIDKIEVVESKLNGADYTLGSKFAYAMGTKKATVTLPRDGSCDGLWSITLKSTDKAGRTSDSYTITTRIDGTKPTLDTSSFKIGGVLHTADKWYNGKILKAGTTANDASTGSGLDTVYYKIVPQNDTTSYTDLKDDNNGSLGLSGATKAFELTVEGLSESNVDGKNKLLLQVYDRAGNKSDVAPFIVAVDETLPNIASKFYTYGSDYQNASGTVMSNKKNDLTLYANVNDINTTAFGTNKVQSGIGSVALKLVGSNGSETDLEAAITYSSSELDNSANIGGMSFNSSVAAQSIKSMKAVIDKSKLTNSGSVKAIVTDVAGNTVSQILFSLAIDDTPPEIVLKNPSTVLVKEDGTAKSDGELRSVDGTITIEGTASDPSLTDVKVYYSVGDQTNFVQCNMGSGSTLYNWKTTPIQMSWVDGDSIKMIGGASYSGSAEDVFIKIVAGDTAGNVKEKIYRYSVDPENDRPKIRISNVSLLDSDGHEMSDTNPVWCRFDTIYGTVSDDDGAVQSMEYRIGTSGSFINANLSNGSWSINLGDEGENRVYFKVIDANGGEFISNTAVTSSTDYSYCTTPKLESGETSLDRTSILNMKLDLNPPNIGNLKYQTSENGIAWSTPASEDFTGGFFGGPKYKYIRLSIEAKDTNGIANVQFALDDETTYANYTATGAGENGFTIYYSDKFDLSGYSGSTRAFVSVTDNAGLNRKPEKATSFNVDNTDPELTVKCGTRGHVSTTSTIYGTIDDASETDVYYTITKNGVNPAAETTFLGDSAAYAVNGWKKVNDATIAYTVYFDGAAPDASDPRTHSQMLKDYLTENALNVTTAAAIQEGTFDTVTKVDVHIMAIDKCGNINQKFTTVEVDPTGDRPELTISKPDDNSILGGTVTVYGSASDMKGANPGIQGVGVFMDVDGDGAWTWEDINIIHTKAAASITAGKLLSENDYIWAKFNRSENPQFAEVDYADIPSNDVSQYCLKATVDGSAWSLDINRGEEFNPPEGQQQNIHVWAFAVDNDGFTSSMDFASMPGRSFMIDAHAPKLDNEKLTKVVDGVTLEQNYKEGIALKKLWTYEADIYDDVGISKIELGGTALVLNSTIGSLPSGVSVTELPASFAAGHGYHIAIGVGSDENGYVGSQTLTIKYTEKKDGGSATTQTREVKINIDNKAPDLLENTDSAFKIGNGRVANTGHFYTFGSKAMEPAQGGVSQTGVSRVAFYVTRDVDGIEALYDPMFARGNANSHIDSYKSSTDWVKDDGDGLYWLERTTSEATTTNTVKITESNPHIHAGGLAKINGVIYRIQSVSGTTVTLGTKDEGTPVTLAAGKKIYFALANVVDNTVQEGDGSETDEAGYYVSPNYDDDDKMIESLVKQGTTWTWEANINTKNIGDGSAVLHYVVFDEAGNSASDSVDIFIANNQPRIAGLTVKTDTNGSNVYDSDESETKSIVYAEGINADTNKAVTSLMFPATSTKENPRALFTVRNKLAIIPEIVGGNGGLKYTLSLHQYANETDGWDSAYKTLTKTALTNALGVGLNGSGDNYETPAAGFIEYEPKDMITDGFADGDSELVKIVIEDSTPGNLSQDEKDKMQVYISIILNFKLMDSTPPVIKIRPLYWNSKDDNSLFGNSTKNGHIELPKDLPETFTVGNADKEMDRHPKLSGKIRLEGVAQDDSQLNEIKIDFFGLGEKTLGTYSGSWTSAKPLVEGAIPSDGYAFEVSSDVTYADLVNCGIIASVPSGKKASDVVTQFADNGHVAKWTVYIDTEKIMPSKVVDSDQTISVKAWDRGSPSASGTYTGPNNSTPGSAQSGGNDGTGATTGYYTVDVVPYITDITTSLTSKLKSSIKSAYSRTSLGHYIARSDENISIKGFNLGTSSIKPKYGSDALNVDANGTVTLPASKMSTSGPIVLTLGTIKTLNNLNDNDACGSYRTQTTSISEESSYADKAAYAYNRVPNRTSNNLLTDDVVIDVWQFDSDAAKPRSGELREPIMRINPVTGQVGLAFVSGPAHFSMANADDSYITWQRNYATYNNISFAYDTLGYAHATSTGLDTNPSSHHAGRFSYFYNKWTESGLDTQSGNYDGQNAIRLESIAVPYVADNMTSSGPTYAQYEAYGHAFAQAPLYRILANETKIDTDDGALTETRFYSPSMVATVHGTGDSAATSVYLAYYDSVQRQVRFRYNSEVPASKGNKDNFVDNIGYQHGSTANNNDTGSNYYEANTDNFSLIAGVDTQQGMEYGVGPYTNETTGSVAKTDADGNVLYKITDYRQTLINADGSLKDKKNKGYTIQTLEITSNILNAINEGLRSRFSVGDVVNCIRNGNYMWIIQDDGLIYYTTDNNAAKGYMTLVPSTQQINDHKFSGRTLEVDESYIVYEKVPATTGYYYRDTNANGQPEYFWPYSDGTKVTIDNIPIVTPAYTFRRYDTGYTAYKYVAIDAITGSSASSDVVVAVWNDGNSLRYAYNDNPTSGLDNGSAGGWKGNKVIFSDGGEHCAIKVDSQGHIHIAAYVDGGLRYAYLDSYGSDYTEATDSVLVDSFTITGERISIDAGIVDYTKSDGTTVSVMVPYISYYNGTSRLPTVAKLVIPESGVMNYKAQGTGTEDGDDIFTGNWDVSIVPSPETLTAMYYDKINIGLWKQNGKIVKSNDNRFTGSAKDKTSANNTSATDNGQIYGNGTANPILGYAIESKTGTCLETAQMK